HPVAVNRDWLPLQRANEKVRDPSLILGAALVRAIDAAHAKYNRGEAKSARVVDYVLVSRAFRAAIGAVKIERAMLADAMLAPRLVLGLIAVVVDAQPHVGQAAVHFIRRS